MAAAGARSQKPVGSASWVAAEKENVVNLVNQELEEVEYPVRHEMDWLNEHMAEIFSNNHFNFKEAFKTPGKLRGKTPRTIRKRDPNEHRVPLSQIFSSSHNRTEDKLNSSPGIHRSPTKAITAPSPFPPPSTAKPTSKPENASPLKDAGRTQNLNSFQTYNTDSGYHGMSDHDDDSGVDENEEEDDDDDMVLTQVQPESQPATQPFEEEPVEPVQNDTQQPRSSMDLDRRTSNASFHSAQEEVRQRGQTVEPMVLDATPKQIDVQSSQPQPAPEAPESVQEPEPEVKPQNPPKARGRPPKERPSKAPPSKETPPEEPSETHSSKEPQSKERLAEGAAVRQPIPESPTEKEEPTKAVSPSPVKAPATRSRESIHEDEAESKDEMVLDSFDDIGSPSDGSTPERPPVRKSSLSFASLPAREPLMKKSLGGSRLSRTSYVDVPKLTNAGPSGYLGRQTGGTKAAPATLDEPDNKMDVDDDKPAGQEESDADARASKIHNKSSTQRLHEKISMLGKLQPSRPTKSIPAVPGLSAQVSYPELPTAKADAKPETTTQQARSTPGPEPKDAPEDDWIRPLNSPAKQQVPNQQTLRPAKTPSEGQRRGGEEVKLPAMVARDQSATRPERPASVAREPMEGIRGRSATPLHSSPQRPSHKKSASVSIPDAHMSTTPIGSPGRRDGPLSASKSRFQSIVRSAKGLFTNAGGVSGAARMEASSPSEPRTQPDLTMAEAGAEKPRPQSARIASPPRQEGRRTRSSTEREEKRRQRELEERKREEEEAEQARSQEKQRALQLKAAQEKATTENEARGPPSAQKPQVQKQPSKEPDTTHDVPSKLPTQIPMSQHQSKQNERRPVKPARDTAQKPKPQPVSIRVGSALSRQMPLASSAVGGAESNVPVPPPSASKPPTIRKKASNQSLHTASSNSSFKSSVSSQTQKKAQLASERKREQEEREARRREEQRRELERKRAAAQQQEETRRQEMRSRMEAERRDRLGGEDSKKAAHMQAIEKRRLENARRMERQGSQQPSDRTSTLHHERPASQATQRSELGTGRPASRLGSIQTFGRSINPPQPNPAKPPKRGLDEEASHRSAAPRPGPGKIPSGEVKRRRTEDEQNPVMRPTMAPPIRQSNIRKESMIRKEPTKSSIFGHGPSMAHPGSSILNKPAQSQRPGGPMDLAKYASGKIPFAEPSHGPSHKTPVASSSQKAPAKPSPQYPNGENVQLPEIATDSEDEDSDSDMVPVPKWAQPKELESLLRQQEGMEVDSIFGPIAPFSLEETFKADKKIKKFRERTSSANWSGADGLTQDEIRRDLAERQRLRLNGGWSFNGN